MVASPRRWFLLPQQELDIPAFPRARNSWKLLALHLESLSSQSCHHQLHDHDLTREKTELELDTVNKARNTPKWIWGLESQRSL